MLNIDKTSRKPIYEQIIESIEREISAGILYENDKLPSIRELSVSLSINPNTIQKAFYELDRTGIIVTYPGRGCFIAPDAKSKILARQLPKLNELSELAATLHRLGVDKDTLISTVSNACDQLSDERKENL